MIECSSTHDFSDNNSGIYKMFKITIKVVTAWRRYKISILTSGQAKKQTIKNV